MKFEWDHVKEKANRDKHKVVFTEVAYIFADKYILNTFDEEHSEDEDRWVSVGQTPGGEIFTVVHTYGKIESDERIRIISVRKATKLKRLGNISKGGDKDEKRI